MSLKRKKQIVTLAEQGGACYIGAIVLGLNDALVELTGALAGFTMALQNNQLIALAGLTTGVAATLSMAASEFLSQEADINSLCPGRAALYTGIAYLITVALLLLPFFILESPMIALGFCLVTAAEIIIVFTFVLSRMRHTNFFRDCARMLSISLGVAAIAFGISWLAKLWWGISV